MAVMQRRFGGRATSTFMRVRAPSAGLRTLVVLGWLALVVAEVAVLAWRPSLLQVGLAAVATALLAIDRRLGPLGAALAVALAVPFGRAADVDLVRFAGLPIRPQDAAIGIGCLIALVVAARRFVTRLRTEGLRLSRDPIVLAPHVVLYAFILIGVFAIGLGIGRQNSLRDVFRDVRWWFLYAAILVAMWHGTRWPALVRGLLAGTALFSALIVVTAILPEIAGGLRTQAMTYDWGALRLQFTNDVFVLAAVAFVGWRALHTRQLVFAGLLGLYSVAIVLSQTRTAMLLALAILGILGLMLAWQSRRSRRYVPAVVAAGRVSMTIVAGSALALAVLLVLPDGLSMPAQAQAQPAPSAKPAPSKTTAPTVVERVTFSGPENDLDAIDAGRFEAYRRAATSISRSPVFGVGMGSLVPLGKTFGNTKPATIGYAPGVDDAYLTVALKGGLLAVPVFVLLMLLPMLGIARTASRRLAPWYVPAWLGLVGLTVTQSYATSGYGPFALALLLGIPLVGRARRRRRPAPQPEPAVAAAA